MQKRKLDKEICLIFVVQPIVSNLMGSTVLVALLFRKITDLHDARTIRYKRDAMQEAPLNFARITDARVASGGQNSLATIYRKGQIILNNQVSLSSVTTFF